MKARRTYIPALAILITLIVLGACSGPDPTDGEAGIASSQPDPTPSETASSDEGQAASSPISEPDPTATSTPSSESPVNPTDTARPPTPTTPPTDPTATTPSPPATTPPPPPTATTPPAPTSVTEPSAPGSILPGHRVISYYGHPSTETMGVLGAYSKEEALEHLRAQAAEFEAVDPNTPVKLAFEIIATVAQPVPGPDGTYLLYTGDEWLQEYVDFTAANDILLILDLQIGHNTIENEINRVLHFLELPHVHVALDPEFSTGPNEIPRPPRAPGDFIGEVNGHDVQKAMEMLAEIRAQHNLPNKILIVHQFEHEMIFNKNVITPVEGVDFVLDMDGFGGPDAKLGNYNVFVNQELIEYGGIKLFYKQDNPMLDPATVVGLNPAPLVVIYQ